tara:strand:+ start:108 stop:416 length:309 start_codon:yes stop_codon:yes gene_type:complete
MKRKAGLFAIASNVVTWGCVGLLTGEVAASNGTPSPALTHDQIMVTLPVYVTSILATAVFTWTIAQYDRKRDRKLDHIEQMNNELKREIGSLREQIQRRNKT